MKLMFDVDFYEDKNGKQPVKDLLLELRGKASSSKDARIQYQRILTHIRALETYGTRIGEPHVKHIDGNLWELRPQPNRILFFYWRDNKFILLHHFVKKTQKTPPKEIELAKQCMRDFIERNE
ncbi:MAG: type II toxin-antitoxin system RelE/ParE family toxin [Clostridiales Family XIII bacterium]|jgi:phage-related protein|nr:type II toxin-antitoxin system RelE/ParE family toxin [Clostridiales Family XIII bacterium]